MRTAFVETIKRLAKKDRNLWLLTGDLGFSVLEDFASKYPNQYLNMGVSEQNMVGAAAGLALSGKTVFAYSIIPFITLRPLEHVRNDICMQNANVKLVGVGSGFSYGQLGPTHHSIEDVAVMRSLPNMVVVCPGDPWEVEEATKAVCKIKGPAYLRIGKKGEPELHNKKSRFKLGKGIIMQEGKDVTIIACGSMLESAVLTSNVLTKSGLTVRLISMHTVKPLDEQLVAESALKTGAVFTMEEHSIIGGLGSAVSQLLAENGIKCDFHSFGVDDKFTKLAGSQDYLKEVNGLSVKSVVKSIKNKLSHD